MTSQNATSSSDRYEAARKALEAYDRGPHLRAVERVADALRALIEPSATGETPEQIAGTIADKYLLDTLAYTNPDVLAAITAAVHAGIQAAWESWEPENAPGHDQSWEYGWTWADKDADDVRAIRADTWEEARQIALSHQKIAPVRLYSRITTDWNPIKEESA